MIIWLGPNLAGPGIANLIVSHPDVQKLRLDVMTKMRGCDDFEQLWQRRTTIEDLDAKSNYEVLSIEDLVKAKKTQRDKDWPMIRLDNFIGVL